MKRIHMRSNVSRGTHKRTRIRVLNTKPIVESLESALGIKIHKKKKKLITSFNWQIIIQN